METTQLYIELVIIGLEAFGWISFFVIDIIGNKVVSIFNNILNNFSTSVLLIGVLYVIGILIDRLADIIFQKKKSLLEKI